MNVLIITTVYRCLHFLIWQSKENDTRIGKLLEIDASIQLAVFIYFQGEQGVAGFAGRNGARGQRVR